MGIGWDEQTDLGVATAYVTEPSGWLVGSDIDPINVRLPMAATAALFALLGTPDLLTARLLACLMGALTLVAVMVFCRRELDDRKALLAGLLLATNPYFLAFSRSAFSEGDAFVTCALAWVITSLAALRHHHTLGRAAVAAVALGAALASKISAVAAIPVIALTLLWRAPDERREEETLRRPVWLALVALMFALYASVFGGWEIGKRISETRYEEVGSIFLAGHALIVVSLWCAVLVVSRRYRGMQLAPARLTLFVLIFGALCFFVLPPLHTTNPDIVNQLFGAFLFSTTATPAAFAIEAAALHFAVIAIKPSLLIGAAAWVSVGVASYRVRGRPELRIPLFFLLFYGLFLLRLPWAQTFYMLPAFPALMILVADAGVDLFDRHRRTALALAGAALALLVSDMVRSHPDHHLNGYQWVGPRIIGGRPSIGARSLVQIPTDGAEQALRFIEARAEAGSTVVTFVRPWHILEATLARGDLRVENGLESPDAIAQADYVVTTLNAEIDHGYGDHTPTEVFALPYDRARLERDFRPVFRVERAFDFEVAAVWRRNAAHGSASDARPGPADDARRDHLQRTPVPPRPQ